MKQRLGRSFEAVYSAWVAPRQKPPSRAEVAVFRFIIRGVRWVRPYLVVIGGVSAGVFVLLATLVLTPDVVALSHIGIEPGSRDLIPLEAPVGWLGHLGRSAPAVVFVIGGVALACVVVAQTLRYYERLVAPTKPTAATSTPADDEAASQDKTTREVG